MPGGLDHPAGNIKISEKTFIGIISTISREYFFEREAREL
jgi:hypothetical protein